MKKYIFSIAFFAFLALSVQAQKYGYVNSGILLEAMAKKYNSDDELTAFQKPLITEGEEMAQAFEKKKNAFFEEANTGVLSQVAIQQRQTTLQNEAEQMKKYENEVVEKIAAKREELLKPILEEIQQAIDEVAKEGNYTMIFDTSMINTVLYTEEASNIISLIAAKLGITDLLPK